MKKQAIPLGLLLLVIVCLTLVLLAFLVYRSQRRWAREDRPLVLIHAPLNREQVAEGEGFLVSATARAANGVTRVELWVDGELQQVHQSSSPEGTSPFRLSTAWRPASPGTHSLVIRAFDARRARAHASINVQVVEREAPDSEPSGEDGIPPIPGDADGDTVPDAEDASPHEPGLPEHAGRPDSDRDGVPDAEDSEPDRSGSPSAGGAPDADGDGLPDADDTCPWDAGPPGSNGCPDTGAGDSDSDGIPDDVDLAPKEAGLPIHGGCPPPGLGADTDGNRIPDDEEPSESSQLTPSLARLSTEYVEMRSMSLVELEALDLEVDQGYDEVYCYVGLAGGDMERYGTFQPLGGNHWDIAEFLGGENGRVIRQPDDLMEVQMECTAQTFAPGPHGFTWGTHYDLGSLTRHHHAAEWYGHDIVVTSEGGDEDHSFQATYRLCVNSCEATVIPPPVLSLFHVGGDAQLLWMWDGDRETIDGFKVYINDTYVFSQAPDRFAHSVSRYEPSCGRRYEFHMTAYLGDRESSPSNLAYWTSHETCPDRTGLFEASVRPLAADVLLVTLGSDFSDPFIKPTVDEYIAVLEQTEGLKAVYVELNSMECLAAYGDKTTTNPYTSEIRRVLQTIVEQTGASYILILGGIHHFPIHYRSVPCLDPTDACSLQHMIWGTSGDEVMVPSDAWYIDFDQDEIVDEGLAIGRLPSAYGDVAGVEAALRTATALHRAGGFTLDREICFKSLPECYQTPPYCGSSACEEREAFFDLMSSSDYIHFAGHGTPYCIIYRGTMVKFCAGWMDSVNLHTHHPVIIAYTPCEAGLLQDPPSTSSEVTLATEFLSGGAAAYVARTTTLGTASHVVEHFPSDIAGGMRIGDALSQRMREAALADETSKPNAGQICLYGDPTLRRRP